MNKDRSIFLLGVACLEDVLTGVFGLIMAHWVSFPSGVVPHDESWWTSGGAINYQPLSSYLGLLAIGSGLFLETLFSKIFISKSAFCDSVRMH
jgi:hypothetical protein